MFSFECFKQCLALSSAWQRLESARNLFAGKGLRQLFGYTWLKSAEDGLRWQGDGLAETLQLSAISLRFPSHRQQIRFLRIGSRRQASSTPLTAETMPRASLREGSHQRH